MFRCALYATVFVSSLSLVSGRQRLNRVVDKSLPELSYRGDLSTNPIVFDVSFVPPATSVFVDVTGGGTVICFTDSGLSFFDETRSGEKTTLGLTTAPFPRISSCSFDGGIDGATFTNIRSE